MDKYVEQFYMNIITSLVYVIVAMLVCVYAIGTVAFKFALFLACVCFVAFLSVYLYQRRKYRA